MEDEGAGEGAGDLLYLPLGPAGRISTEDSLRSAH